MTTTAVQKRKADAIGRIAQSSSVGGRGALVGWVPCPLCGRHSAKQYALGRGLASHLQAVHTPWKPGKMELKIRRRKRERRRNEAKQAVKDDDDDKWDAAWDPTSQERKAWEEEMLQILKQAEDEHASSSLTTQQLDRRGHEAESYRESLPDFIQAASNGYIDKLRSMLKEACDEGTLEELLDTRDRHLSVADHWAAGSGHLDCLKLLIRFRKKVKSPKRLITEPPTKKIRRRDGKTCLHYAARNGQMEVLEYLLEEDKSFHVNVTSGDGTTPLHLAVYGGHVDAVHYLVAKGADPLQANEWGCTCAHWLAMCRPDDAEKSVPFIGNFLLTNEAVSITDVQNQGHSPLHKAAQSKNVHFLRWGFDQYDKQQITRDEMKDAIQPDQGGHTPLDIWRATKGDEDTAAWMEKRFNEILSDSKR